MLPIALRITCVLSILFLHDLKHRCTADLLGVTDIDEGNSNFDFRGPAVESDTKVADNFCTTEACVARAATMLQAINTSVDPCDDFFRYACSNWMTLHPIPADYSSWGAFKQMQQQTNTKLLDMMQTAKHETSSARQKARMVYEACMDLEKIEKLGATPFISSMKAIIGSWPLLDNLWDSSQFDVLDMYAKFSQTGQTYVQSISGSVNVDNPRENLLEFGEMSLGLASKKMYYEPSRKTVRRAYLALMKNLTKLLSEDLNVTLPVDLDRQLQEIMDYETSIANISYTSVEARNPDKIFNGMTLNDFIDGYFNRTFKKSQFLAALRAIPRNSAVASAIQLNMPVNVVNPTYYRKLDDIWFHRLNGPNPTITGKRFLANYLGWRMLLDAAPLLSKRYRDASFEFQKVYSGVTEQSARAITCVNFASNGMELAMGSMYVEQYFGTDSKAKLVTMANDIRASFKTILENAEWMDTDTRNRALAKLEAMTAYLGYPDFLLLDLPRLDRFYEEYDITDVHFLNGQTIDIQTTARSFGRLIEPNLRNVDETTNPVLINAYYMQDKNMIAILAGVSQPPVFHKDYPDYLNYAALGQFFGHEITHGFDDGGSRFDEEGKLSMWWTNASRLNFNERTKAIIEQYSNYNTTGGPVNGKLTVGENIADNAGVKESFMAYKEQLERLNGTKPLILPGLQHFSVDQTFLLASAQAWCGYYRPQYLKNVILLDVHSPFQFRVNGPMSNLPEFAQAFNCSVGSKMNPVQKAGVW